MRVQIIDQLNLFWKRLSLDNLNTSAWVDFHHLLHLQAWLFETTNFSLQLSNYSFQVRDGTTVDPAAFASDLVRKNVSFFRSFSRF